MMVYAGGKSEYARAMDISRDKLLRALIGRLGKNGMRETVQEILRIMLG